MPGGINLGDGTLPIVERLRALLKQATARPWRAFDRGNVRAIMKGNEPPRKANGYHSREWPEIVAWAGFDSSNVPERYRSPNLHLIVEAVNALPELLTLIEQQAATIAELEARDREIAHKLQDARTTLTKRAYGRPAITGDNLVLPPDAFNSIVRSLDAARTALAKVTP